MARRKSVCVKWTLVFSLVLLSSFVYSRPQDSLSTVTTSHPIAETETSAETVLRYHEKRSISDETPFDERNFTLISSSNSSYRNNYIFTDPNRNNSFNKKPRESRLLERRITIPNNRNKKKRNDTVKNQTNPTNISIKKPIIKRVITKWTDNAKYEDLKLSNISKISFDSDMYSDDYSSTEYDISTTTQRQYIVPNKLIQTKYRPNPQYSAETQIYSSNVQVYDDYPHSYTRPTYIFTTPRPTPIITNVGYPQPWPDNTHVSIKPTTRRPNRPSHPNYPQNYNNIHSYTPHVNPNLEVSTIKTNPSYSDKIVIRPEEYNASPYDCPTIFLSLNNTFQGEGKEVCPDLNIAVNTNVINKNVVVDSEEDTDTTLTDVFGLPFGESESEEGTNTDDYTESSENEDQTESVSIEGQSLTNYNSANDLTDEISLESSSFGQNTAMSIISRPKRPGKKNKDIFGLSSVVNFFQPVLKGFNWLAAINPLSFSAVSLVLTPLVLLVGLFSYFVTAFTPWAFSYARDASVSPNNSPHWQWNDYYKTWHSNRNTFQDNRKLKTAKAKDTGTSANLGHLINMLHNEIEKTIDTNKENFKNKRRKRKKRNSIIK